MMSPPDLKDLPFLQSFFCWGQVFVRAKQLIGWKCFTSPRPCTHNVKICRSLFDFPAWISIQWIWVPFPSLLREAELRNYSKRRGRGEGLAVLISQSRASLREWWLQGQNIHKPAGEQLTHRGMLILQYSMAANTGENNKVVKRQEKKKAF